jgi:two-component system, sensor histidine kinase and response regulator
MSLIGDILDYAELESGHVTPGGIEFSLRGVLDDVLMAMSPQARAKKLPLVFHIEPEVPAAVIGDPERLRTIVGHLVSNAIKFTERGQVVIRMEKEMLVRNGIILHCSVSDTGVGIPPEKEHEIFDVFTQADGSSTRGFGGAGLGLAICSRLVKLLGGRIWVNSEPGTGSKFHFTFRQGLSRAGRRTRNSPRKEKAHS